MKRTFKYYLKLNQSQKQRLEQTLTDCNFVYNFILREFKERNKNNQKQPTEHQLIKFVVEIKKNHPQLKRTHSGVFQDVARRVYKNWIACKKRGEELENVKDKLRFKPIHRYNSFTYPLPIERNDCGYKLDNSPLTKKKEKRKLKLTLGRQGHNVYLELKIFMERNFEGRVKTLTIKRKNSRYYALFSCNEVKQNLLPVVNKSIGLDLGIKTLIVTSNREKIKNPKFYKKSEAIIKQVQKTLDKKIIGSKNWLNAKFSLAKRWEKITNQFKYYSYQQVNWLVKNYDKISVENLNVKNMLTKKVNDNKKSLRRNLLGARFGILLQVIADKVEETGRQLVRVNPNNTTQQCSECGELSKEKIKLNQRIFECWNCELELDRDVNSAKNILKFSEMSSIGTLL